MVVVGGNYSPNHNSSRWMVFLSTGTSDSPVRTRHCTVDLSGAYHVSRPLGFETVDR
jgi:hypothetical protein